MTSLCAGASTTIGIPPITKLEFVQPDDNTNYLRKENMSGTKIGNTENENTNKNADEDDDDHSVGGNNDDCSYEELVVSDEEEYLEYYEEILDAESESEFTEVTCGSDGDNFPYNNNTASSMWVGGLGGNGHDSIGGENGITSSNKSLYAVVPPSRQSSNDSISSFTVNTDFVGQRKGTGGGGLLNVKRPVIKSSKEKAFEEEKAKIELEEEEISKAHQYKLARRNSFCRKDAELIRQLQEEEEEHLREEEELELQRIEEENRLAQQQNKDAIARIQAQQKQNENNQNDQQQLEQERIEKERREQEEKERKRKAEVVAQEKIQAELVRKEKERLAYLEREEKKRAMELEVRKLEMELAEKKKLAAEAEEKRHAEQARLHALALERRQAKKQQQQQQQKRKSTDPKNDETNTTIPANTTTTTTANICAENNNTETSTTVTKTSTTNIVSTTSAEVAITTTSTMTSTTTKNVLAAASGTQYYPLDVLRKMTIPGLDYKNREIYLEPKEYITLFGMSKIEFEQQPKWKKTTLKRKAKLF